MNDYFINETKEKRFKKELVLIPGDELIENQYSSTILLSSKNKNQSILYLNTGRYNERPDVNNDSACIVIHEGDNIDSYCNYSSKQIKESDDNSFVLVNADKVRINSKKGNISFTSNKSLVVSVSKTIEIYSSGDINIKSDGNINIESNKNINYKCRNFKVDSQKFEINSDNVFLGKNANQPLILGTVFKSWSDSHTHISTQPGSPTTPPIPSPLYLSRIVKVK
jgi:hypothetical protein